MPNGNADRPISGVLSDILGNAQNIVRSELRLAKTELSEELRKSRSAAVMLGVGLLLLVFSAMFALLAAVYGLSLVVPAWAAALIVTAGLGLVAALFCALGIKRFKSVRPAPRTTASLKENMEWARHLTR
jgi:uncharacterized membrane protein YqjE